MICMRKPGFNLKEVIGELQLKNMKKLLIYKMGIVLLLVGGVISCNDLSLAPSNEFTEENYWTSSDKAEMVLNTAYSQMSNATYFFYNAALSDNAYMGRGDAASVSTIAQGNHNPSTNRFNNQWDLHYSGIKTTHVFLENIDNVSDMDESVKARMKAEARFIRAWHYFRLTNWFGDVPHFTEDISVERSQNIESTSHEDIVAFIHEELNSIQSDLPVRGEYSQADRGRITRGAAIALGPGGNACWSCPERRKGLPPPEHPADHQGQTRQRHQQHGLQRQGVLLRGFLRGSQEVSLSGFPGISGLLFTATPSPIHQDDHEHHPGDPQQDHLLKR